MLSRFTKSILLTIAFIIIITLAACKPMAMRRESQPLPAPVAQVEARGRAILVNGRTGVTVLMVRG